MHKTTKGIPKKILKVEGGTSEIDIGNKIVVCTFDKNISMKAIQELKMQVREIVKPKTTYGIIDITPIGNTFPLHFETKSAINEMQESQNLFIEHVYVVRNRIPKAIARIYSHFAHVKINIVSTLEEAHQKITEIKEAKEYYD